MTVVGKNPSLKRKTFITSEFSATKEVMGLSSQDTVQEEGSKRKVKECDVRVLFTCVHLGF